MLETRPAPARTITGQKLENGAPPVARPVILGGEVKRLTFEGPLLTASLRVDDLSFLGREAPSWDVVYWCIVGLFAIAMLLQADFALLGEVKKLRVRVARSTVIVLIAALMSVTVHVAFWPIDKTPGAQSIDES